MLHSTTCKSLQKSFFFYGFLPVEARRDPLCSPGEWDRNPISVPLFLCSFSNVPDFVSLLQCFSSYLALTCGPQVRPAAHFFTSHSLGLAWLLRVLLCHETQWTAQNICFFIGQSQSRVLYTCHVGGVVGEGGEDGCVRGGWGVGAYGVIIPPPHPIPLERILLPRQWKTPRPNLCIKKNDCWVL